MSTRFQLDWFGGSSAVVDLQTEERNGSSCYLLQYTSPFRPTMRAPRQELPAGQHDLDQIDHDLDDFAARLGGALATGGGPPLAPTPQEVSELSELGQQIFDLVLPTYVRSDLRKRDLFVELGTDEGLLHFPWELMHDGEDFVCLKHFVGRYVNLRRTPEVNGRTLPEPGSDLGDLRVLLIGVPRPKPHGGPSFPPLPAVEREMEAIMATLGKLGVHYEYLDGPDATRTNVLRALRTPYHIIHFSGHASFDPQDPRRSALVLDDVDLSVGALTPALAEQRSVLCVVNACETTRTGGGQPANGADAGPLSWRDQYNIYGLARAFLENGAYLLGSRWKLPDESAKRFTEAFYESLLGDGDPIGRAITHARAAVKSHAASDDFSWASYVYYGDPRVCFHSLPDGEPASAVVPPAPAPPEVSTAVQEAARDYENVRNAEPPSPERTLKLSNLVANVASLASEVLAAHVIAEPSQQSAGDRIVSLGLLEAAPDARHFDFVMKVLEAPLSPFEEYHALKAMATMLPDVTDTQEQSLATLLKRRIEEDQGFFGTDRFLVASQILGRIQENDSETGT